MTDLERQELEEKFNAKYGKKIKRMEEKAFIMQKDMEIKSLKKNLRRKLGLTTTKLLSYYIFIMFNAVLIYALVAMWHFEDLSYLGVIISDILGQVLVYGIYSIRAYKDTKSEEDMKFQRDKLSSLPNIAQEKIDRLFEMMDNTITGSDDTTDDEPQENNDEEIIYEDNSDVIEDEN